MEHRSKSVSVSIRSHTSVVALPASLPRKQSARAVATRLRKSKAAIRRFQEFKRNIVANPEKQGPVGRKPYFIYEKLQNLTPLGLYDPQFPSVSEKTFTGLPAARPPKITRMGMGDRPLNSASASSMTSFASRASRFSVHGRGSVAPSMVSFGLASFTMMSLRSAVLESDEEQEIDRLSTDRAPSMFRLREDPPPRKQEIKASFTVVLNESNTVFWLEIPSTAYPEDSEEGVAVKERNEEYERTKNGSKTISHTAMQTTRMFQKHQHLYVPRNTRTNSSAYVTVWDIYDLTEQDKRGSDSSQEGMTVLEKATPFEEESYDEVFEFQEHKFSGKLLKALMVMERLIIKEDFSKNQLLFQGLLLEDPLSLEVNFQYTLNHLWTFSCEKTKERKVTSICGNPANQNILAVGYGKFKYTDKCDGLVCIWNVKNPQDPERIYQFKDPVTYVIFSSFRPQILAISFYSGLILLVDIISRTLRVKATNSHYPLYYPVWQTLWSKQGDEFHLLLSCDKHGRVFRYKKTNFFLSKKIMSMGRPYGTIQGVEQSKKCYARKTLLNRHPSAEVMVAHPSDPLIYLVGTAEGFVYICSINHRHEHLDVFVAHDGPIYNIQFNPFCDKIFLTCGADYSIRIWAEGIFEPLVTLESGMSAIQHALWDPLHSTIIVSITGIYVEVGPVFTAKSIA